MLRMVGASSPCASASASAVRRIWSQLSWRRRPGRRWTGGWRPQPLDFVERVDVIGVLLREAAPVQDRFLSFSFPSISNVPQRRRVGAKVIGDPLCPSLVDRAPLNNSAW
jgi:hypothetical protein